MPEYSLEVSAKDAGKRLDIFLADFSKKNKWGLSRVGIQRLIFLGSVRVKNSDLVRAHYRIKAQDQITVFLEEKKSDSPAPEDIPLQVVYQDQDICVIDKPCGLVVHPAPGNYQHTLVNALLYHIKELSDLNPQRPGIVHRLDKETSGLLVIAKNNPAHLVLAKAFSEHSIKRKYIALVKGSVAFDQDVIELPIGRHPYKRQSMACGLGKSLREAKTSYRTLIRSEKFSMLELEPFTGRTHQLRVHLAFLDHPILGDSKYGKQNKFPRLALHAKYLGFTHPGTNKFIDFSSSTPPEFLEFVEKNKT